MNGLLVDLGAVSAASALPVVGVPMQDPEPPPGKGEEFGKASPIALVVIVLLGIATVFLIRSMTRRIKKLPASFDAPGDAPSTGDEAGSTRA
ncbi:hypothetical protein [Pseudonocardia sp. GCM10023141]|uniref:hypothetical protein n=1 Tax=Pseudonocardia sp. GCM10023141 TaxID=3252653 RepID=UPI0036165427